MASDVREHVERSLSVAIGRHYYENNIDFDILRGVHCLFRCSAGGQLYIVPGNEVADMGNRSAREDELIAVIERNESIFFSPSGDAHITCSADDPRAIKYGPAEFSKAIHVNFCELNRTGISTRRYKGWLCLDLG